MILLKLYAIFFQIGLFSFGGGYAALPLIQEQMVDVTGWLSHVEMLDLISISQITPGPIAINAATFVGTRVAGIIGSLVATLGLISPSIIIVLLLSYLYFKYRELKVVDGLLTGFRPAVVSMIAIAALGILFSVIWQGSTGIKSLSKDMLVDMDFKAIGIFVVGLVVLRKFKLNPIVIMLASGAVGLLLYGVF